MTSSRSPARATARPRSGRWRGAAAAATTPRSSTPRWPSPATLLGAAGVPDAWERVIAAEPEPVATISGAGLASVARAFGEFGDVKVAFLHGHSSRVAELAATAAEALGCSRPETAGVRAAGFVHDVGRVSVPNGIWDKPGPLSAAERERVRLHPYYTERVLERSRALAPLAAGRRRPPRAARRLGLPPRRRRGPAGHRRPRAGRRRRL